MMSKPKTDISGWDTSDLKMERFLKLIKEQADQYFTKEEHRFLNVARNFVRNVANIRYFGSQNQVSFVKRILENMTDHVNRTNLEMISTELFKTEEPVNLDNWISKKPLDSREDYAD